jgi:hypothetical protein
MSGFGDDWQVLVRDMATQVAAEPNTQFAVCPGYVEGKRREYFIEPALTNIYLAPLRYYRANLTIIPLPPEMREAWQLEIYARLLRAGLFEGVPVMVASRFNCNVDITLIAALAASSECERDFRN